MASIAETSGAKAELGAGLAEGVATLSLNQTVNFTLYVKMILPIDQYVFWINGSLLTDTALYNAAQYNRLEFDNLDPAPMPSRQLSARGSLHFASDVNQLEDSTPTHNHMIFTSVDPVVDFNEVNPLLMYIARENGVKFAFNQRGQFYKQADLYHYRGDALYSVMGTQVIDSMTDFDTISPIVSNSLPVWLGLNKFFPVYPSFLVPQNAKPPYAAVDINPAQTSAIQAFPLLDQNSNPMQLVKDSVKITIFGKRNNDALNFASYVFQYSLDTDAIGVMNMPVIQDEKLPQSEFSIIAMKKSILFEVSYFQTTVNDLARQLILSAFINVTIAPL